MFSSAKPNFLKLSIRNNWKGAFPLSKTKHMKKLLIIIALLLSSGVLAETSIGLFPTKIVFDEEIIVGKQYQLEQKMLITNYSDRRLGFVSQVARVERDGFNKLEQEWFTLVPSTFELEPNGSQAVLIEFLIPKGRENNGKQFDGIIESKVMDGGKSIGVSVGSKVEFRTRLYEYSWKDKIENAMASFNEKRKELQENVGLSNNALLIIFFIIIVSVLINLKKKKNEKNNKSEQKGKSRN